jgi:hypothetical protein
LSVSSIGGNVSKGIGMSVGIMGLS